MSQQFVMLGGTAHNLSTLIEGAKKLKHKRITLKSLARCIATQKGLVPEKDINNADLQGEILYTVLPGVGPTLVYGAPQLLLAARKREIKIRAKEIPAAWLV